MWLWTSRNQPGTRPPCTCSRLELDSRKVTKSQSLLVPGASVQHSTLSLTAFKHSLNTQLFRFLQQVLSLNTLFCTFFYYQIHLLLGVQTRGVKCLARHWLVWLSDRHLSGWLALSKSAQILKSKRAPETDCFLGYHTCLFFV